MSTRLPTLTHARIRAMQGDVDGARRIVQEILSARPGDCAARALLDEIGLTQARERPEPSDESRTDSSVLALRTWLERIQKAREHEPAR